MIHDITLLRALGILLVVAGHSDISGQHTPFFYPFFEKFIYSFHMPLFMFISGYVFMFTNYDKENFCYSDFIQKKFVRLIVPALFVLTIAFILRAFLAIFKERIIEYNYIANYFSMFFFKHFLPIEFFWYIFTLFNIFLLSFMLLSISKNTFYIILFSLLLIFLNIFYVDIEFLYIKYTAKFLVYFWFGSIFFIIDNKYLFYLYKFCDKKNLVILLFLFFLILLLSICNYFSKFSELASAFFGIIMSIFLVRMLGNFNLQFMSIVGKYSYQIFLLSWFFHRSVETVGFKKYRFDFLITYPVSIFIAVLFPILISKFIEKNVKNLKFLIGLK